MGRWKVFEIPGVAHGAPIPLAAQVGNMVWSSAMMGVDAASGELPDDGPSQVRHLFANTAALLGAAALTSDDIVYISILLAEGSLRDEVNRYWLEWFPDPADRPARHTSVHPLQGGMLAQLQFVAIVDQRDEAADGS
jgi:2-iminobutanoate/2-iminopropanoate deaminase